MAHRFSRICVVVNPLAGSRRVDVEGLVSRSLNGIGAQLEFHHTTGPGHATELARAAVSQGADLVVAAGGDGTVNEVGSALVGSEAVMGLLPVGSGNALANALGVPTSPRAACRTLLNARVRRIDVGQVAGRPFFSTAGIGIDAEVSRRYAARVGGRRGFLPYLALTARALVSYRASPVVITLDGDRQIQASPLLATVANTARFGNGAVIAPAADPDDGLLDLCLIDDAAILRRFLIAARLFSGAIDRVPGVQLFRAREIRLERPGGLLQLDGEAVEAEGPLDVKVLRRAIRIAVPRSGAD